MKRYPSKISYGLLLLVLASLIAGIIPLVSGRNWVGISINLAVLVFALYVFFSIYYTIEGNILIIRIGFLTVKRIDISEIKMISKSNSWIGSPAASLDRLNIIYKKHSSILVSPKDKEGFIRELTRLNSNIEISKT
ncbi:PH domain-containing protein [Flagellimonas sp.]|uniref:PH domain-containing protein n=1 Tax=Flagellimonas sp. TaxID=2058762 RepID=UPI003B514DBB